MRNLQSKRTAVVRAAVAVIAAVTLVACGQTSPDKLMASAQEYLAKGDRNAAVIQLKNLLAKAPDHGEARLLLGEALLETGDFASAEKELSRALELKQPHEKVLPAYVRALLAQGKNQRVISEVEKYKLFDPHAVAVTQTALGDAQLQLGSRAQAREAYVAALTAVPGHARARLGNAMIMAMEGSIEDALKETDEVIAAEPKLAEARAFRADLLLAKGDRDGAKKALEEAVAVDDRFLPARLTLIRMLTDERDLEQAAKLAQSTRKVAPGNLRLTYLEGVIAFRNGDTEKARQHVQQVLKYAPEDVASLVLAGAIDLKDGRLAAAEGMLRKALAKAPFHQGARQLLVQTYLRAGQPTKAGETLRPLLEAGMPSDPKLKLLAGETFLANGDMKSATNFFREAAEGKHDQQALARMRLGQVAFARGRFEEGFSELEAAAELDEGQYQADLALIANHLRRGEFDMALKAAEALENKQPKNPLTFQMYGLIHMAKRDLGAARRDFMKALELQPNYLPAALALTDLDLTEGKPGDARKRYEGMIAADSENDQLHLALADLLTRTGADAKEVEKALRGAVNANSQSVAARLGLISFYQRNKDAKGALAVAQDAVAAIPGDPRILYAAAAAQENAGEVNQAIETYGKLAALQPSSVQPLFRLAGLYVRQGNTAKVVETLRRAQKVSPRDPGVVLQLVQVYMAAGQVDDALKEARDLQKREPKFVGGYSIEAEIHFAQGKFAEAERLYRDALKIEPDSNALAVRLHAVLVRAGKKKDAENWARRWIADHPKDAVMLLHLAEQERAAGNLKAAAGRYKAALGADPNSVVALNNLAWIGGELGDPEALGYAERAVQVAPASAEVLDTYGMLLVKKGEPGKALPILERARKIAPERRDLQLNYAKALIGAGRRDDARKELEALRGVKEPFSGQEEVAGLLKSL